MEVEALTQLRRRPEDGRLAEPAPAAYRPGDGDSTLGAFQRSRGQRPANRLG
jgi:hypothetical protein